MKLREKTFIGSMAARFFMGSIAIWILGAIPLLLYGLFVSDPGHPIGLGLFFGAPHALALSGLMHALVLSGLMIAASLFLCRVVLILFSDRRD